MFVALVVGVYFAIYLGVVIAAAAAAVSIVALLLLVFVYILLPVVAIALTVWAFTVVFVPWVVLAGPVLYVGALPWRIGVPVFMVFVAALVIPLYVPFWPVLFIPTLGWVCNATFPATAGLLNLLSMLPTLVSVRECCPWVTKKIRPGAFAFIIAMLIAPWSAFVILFFCMFMRDLWEPLGYALWAFLCFGPMVLGLVAPITAVVLVEISYWH